MNFSWIRVYAVISRHLYVALRDVRAFSQDFFWPLMDLSLWGYMAQYSCKTYGMPSSYVYSMLACVSLWQIFLRSSLEVSVSMLDEIWEKNLVNFFAGPLYLIEWVAACSLLALIRTITTMIIAIIIIKLLFSWMLFSVGMVLIPCALNLFLSGLTIGFLITALLSLFGKKADAFAWMMGWMCAPFSSIYYPAAALPAWMNSVANWMPMMYTFDALKQAIADGGINWNFLGIAFGLNCIYLTGAILLFLICFEQSRKRGLSRLE